MSESIPPYEEQSAADVREAKLAALRATIEDSINRGGEHDSEDVTDYLEQMANTLLEEGD